MPGRSSDHDVHAMIEVATLATEVGCAVFLGCEPPHQLVSSAVTVGVLQREFGLADAVQPVQHGPGPLRQRPSELVQGRITSTKIRAGGRGRLFVPGGRPQLGPETGRGVADSSLAKARRA
jgi:hypothetical protein